MIISMSNEICRLARGGFRWATLTSPRDLQSCRETLCAVCDRIFFFFLRSNVASKFTAPDPTKAFATLSQRGIAGQEGGRTKIH